MALSALDGGKAWKQFLVLVKAQGGDASYVENPDKLPKASLIITVPSEQSGYIALINAREVGETSVDLGAGRSRKEDPIDHAVGIVIHHKVGDYVDKGQPLFTIHANSQAKLDVARARLLAAHQFSSQPVEPLPLFYDVVS